MPPATHPGLLGSRRALAERYDVALLDLDGVVYVGQAAVPGVPAALAEARQRGMRLAFVTNNAARPPEVVAAHLTELGIPAAAAEVITSAQAAAHYLAERLAPGARVLVVGTVGLTEALAERGLVPVDRDDDAVAAVVQGFSPDLDWSQLAQGSLAINRGMPWVATNVDPTVPSPLGRLPGNGSLVAALRYATGAEPVVTGKPDPTMHRESLERSGAQSPIVVGDRLDTDIEGANAVGCASLLVFSGVTTVSDVLAAPPRLRPNYLAADVSGLLTPHPVVDRVADHVSCGRWSVHGAPGGGGLLTAAEPGEGRRLGEPVDAAAGESVAEVDDDLDAVRALCVAAWTGLCGDADGWRAGGAAAERVLAGFALT
jgi:HAD superfamily hydrolase (TIGR01450 family)